MRRRNLKRTIFQKIEAGLKTRKKRRLLKRLEGDFSTLISKKEKEVLMRGLSSLDTACLEILDEAIEELCNYVFK